MRKGFSKTEALGVIIIFGIIGWATWWSYTTAILKSNDVRRKNDVKHISEAVELYSYDYGEFPAEKMDKIFSCGAPKYEDPCEWGVGSFGEPEGVIYMHKIPADPVSPKRNYVYRVNKDKTEFEVFAALEYKLDENFVKNEEFPMCGEARCNFFVKRELKKGLQQGE